MDADGDGINTLTNAQFTQLQIAGQQLLHVSMDVRLAQSPHDLSRAMSDALIQAQVLGMTMNVTAAELVGEQVWAWQSQPVDAGNEQLFAAARDRLADSVLQLAVHAASATIQQSIPLTQTTMAQNMIQLAMSAKEQHQTLQAPEADDDTPDDDAQEF